MENIIGTNFADYIRGSSGQNWLTGEGGNDELHGEAGDDTLEGGAGSDALYGEAGNDLFVPGPGNDLIVGGNDWDLIDYLTSDAGVYLTYSDTTPYLHSDGVTYDLNYAIIGGTETDYIQVTEYARGSDFDDTLIGSNGFNWLAGMGGDDTIEGRGGIDYLYGGTGNDTLKGGAADDDLFGWTGNDTLLGEAGMDELYGEAGDDSLWGGTNTDTFVFAIGAGNDTVEDFQDNYDVLRFTGGLTFLDLTITDDVGGALISYGASDSVLVMNMAAANLTEADMAFV
jgi:Ca2+-binding RTX toxin-like protein